jgi:hypothetical protein
MFVKRAIAAVFVALIIAGVSMAVPRPASAATQACGRYCIGVFSAKLGSYANPRFVEHVFNGRPAVGTRTGLNPASSIDASEDFINPHQGDVADYYRLGLVSAGVKRHYGSLTASQLEYAPFGLRTGLCVGVARAPYPGQPLRLEPCTTPGRTVWIIGTSLSPATAANGFFPIVSGATRDFSHPFAMSYPRHVDTDETLPPIRLRHLRFRGVDGFVPARQLWGVKLGVLQ